jgi:hypothetical protein
MKSHFVLIAIALLTVTGSARATVIGGNDPGCASVLGSIGPTTQQALYFFGSQANVIDGGSTPTKEICVAQGFAGFWNTGGFGGLNGSYTNLYAFGGGPSKQDWEIAGQGESNSEQAEIAVGCISVPNLHITGGTGNSECTTNGGETFCPAGPAGEDIYPLLGWFGKVEGAGTFLANNPPGYQAYVTEPQIGAVFSGMFFEDITLGYTPTITNYTVPATNGASTPLPDVQHGFCWITSAGIGAPQTPTPFLMQGQAFGIAQSCSMPLDPKDGVTLQNLVIECGAGQTCPTVTASCLAL